MSSCPCGEGVCSLRQINAHLVVHPAVMLISSTPVVFLCRPCLQRHRSQGKSPAAASSLASSSARRWRLLPLARCPHCQPSPSLSDPRQRSTSTPCHIREYHRRTGVASVSALAPVLALPMAPALAHQSVLLSVLPSESSLAEPSDLVSPRTTFYCSALSCAPPDTRTRSSSPHCHMIRPARSCCRPMDPT